MINRKIFFLLLIITLISSIGIVSATDISNNDTMTVTDQTEPDYEDTIETPIKTTNKQPLTSNYEATVTNYQELYDNLTNPMAEEDTTIILGGDEETYTLTNTITVSESIKNLVINGNGKTIDGNNNYQFLIVNHTCNLVINNLTIKNCTYLEESTALIGSAIFYNGSEGSNITIDNCTFDSNGNSTFGYTTGGAVAVISDGTTTISNSNFRANVGLMGGAITLWNNGKASITNSTFNENYGVLGGAISSINDGDLELENLEFIKNYDQGMGSAVYINTTKSVRINNITCLNNNATEATVFIEAYNDESPENPYNVSVTNSNFTENYSLLGGSAIAYIGSPGVNFIIDESYFYHNGLPNYGDMSSGTVNINSNGTTIISNSDFIANEAMFGGAIALKNNGTTTIINNTFQENIGSWMGGAITTANDGELVLENNEFIGNRAEIAGGALYLDSTKNITMTNLTFSDNRVTSSESFGGAIYLLSENGTTKIEKSEFYNNSGINQGAISYTGLENSTLEITDSLFDNNGYDYEIGEASTGGAITIKSNSTVRIINTTFKNNLANSQGGAISYIGFEESNLEIFDSNFQSNGFNREGGRTSQGGAIDIQTIGNVTFDNNNFTLNLADAGGAVYYINSPYEGFNYTNNSKFVINNTQFNLQTYNPMIGGIEMGGALYIQSNNTVIIDNSIFSDNVATSSGSAMYYIGTNESNLEINNSKFDSNGHYMWEYTQEGGALYIETQGNTSIENTDLTNNQAYNTVVYYYNSNENSTLTITNITVDSNGRNKQHYYIPRSAIMSIDTVGNITVDSSKFTNNQALEYGALYIRNYNTNIETIINNTLFDSNGFERYEEYTQRGGALTLELEGNASILNSQFNNNVANEGGAVYVSEVIDLVIMNSTFNHNGRTLAQEEMEGMGGAIYISTMGNTTISSSEFTNNNAAEGAAIFYDGSDKSLILNITDTLFDSNCGRYGGTMYIGSANVSITNTNFTNNTINLEGEMEGIEGIVIYSYNSNVVLNHTNFIANGLPSNLTRDDFGEEMEVEGGLIYHHANGENDTNLVIDNSNFISNIGMGEEGAIISYSNHHYSSYRDPTTGVWTSISYSNSSLTINNTEFADNTILVGGEEEAECMGYVVYVSGNAEIDNSYFLYNQLDYTFLGPVYEEEQMSGPLYLNGWNNGNLTSNVTNCVFIENYPSNFRINDSKIKLNYSYIHEYHGNVDYEFMFDGYMPNYANVTIYLDESEEGTQYKLVSDVETNPETGDTSIRDIYVDRFTVNEENYLIKMVVNQTEQSQYYENQTFHNNTYYFILPHDYTLSVNSTSPIKIGDDTTITGKAYFTKTDETEVVFADKPVDLYINGSYIATINTSGTGEYEFNYTGEVLGTQNVTVAFNKSIYLPRIINTTTFDVLIRESVLNIEVNNTKIGKTSNITFILKDTEGNPINDSYIYFYVDDIIANGTTDENGKFTYTCQINDTGHNYVLAFYDGDYGHLNAQNSTVFLIEKLNTTIIITATNTTIHGTSTISGKLVDENNDNIKAPVIIYIDEDTINTQTDENGEFSFAYTATLAGENHASIIYEGNDTYMDSVNKTSFHVDKFNTTITVNAQNTTIGEEINITGTLLDQEGQPITNAKVIIFIDNDEVEINTTESGTFSYEYTAVHPGEKYVEVFYEGNEVDSDSFNSTIFMVDKINTTTTASPTVAKVGNLTFVVNVDGKDGNEITSGVLLVYDENNELIMAHTLSDQTSVTLRDITSGTYNFTIVYEGNETYNPSNTTQTVTIKSEAKIDIEVINNTDGNVQVAINVTDESGNPLADTEVVVTLPNGTSITVKTDSDGIVVVNDTTSPVGEAIIKVSVPETSDVEGAEANKTFTIEPDYQKMIDEMNKTTVIKAVPENNTVGNTKVVVTLNNKLADPICDAPITIVNDKGETIGTGLTDKDGVAVIPVDTLPGSENITAVYGGDSTYLPSNTTAPITTYKINTTITVESVDGVIGENVTLVAHIRDANGNPVSGGNIVFKINGKTLRTDGRIDSTAPVQKFKVENGLVTVTISADISLRHAKNITATYSGSSKYNSARSDVATIQIKQRNAEINLTASPDKQKQYENITFTAIVTDTTPNAKNTTAINQDTYVIFKVNNKIAKVAVKNGKATYTYTIPAGMGGIDENGATKNFVATCTLVNDAYTDTQNTTTFNIERSTTTIDIENATVNSENSLSIKANIKDYKGNNVKGTNKINLKINGKTYIDPKTNKTAYFTVTNGIIDLKDIAVDKNINIKSVTLVTGARNAYLGSRNETTDIVKV